MDIPCHSLTIEKTVTKFWIMTSIKKLEQNIWKTPVEELIQLCSNLFHEVCLCFREELV